MVRYTPIIREIKDKDKNKLYTLLDTNPEIKYRIKIILLANDGYTVPEIRVMTNTYDKTIKSSVITNVITPSSKSLIKIF
ncbi:MAG TPA: hypothetical protein VLA48_04890 [Nitrososphaeraceae archaeon]|nr:hypothetical protein [Nitrososphaeraceae archaeon]